MEVIVFRGYFQPLTCVSETNASSLEALGHWEQWGEVGTVGLVLRAGLGSVDGRTEQRLNTQNYIWSRCESLQLNWRNNKLIYAVRLRKTRFKGIK